jgi:hypothetical protein
MRGIRKFVPCVSTDLSVNAPPRGYIGLDGVGTDVCWLCRRSRNEEETSPECPLAQKEYFWLDSLHPTPPTHEAMAAEIQLMLQNDRFIDRETGNVSSGSSRTYAPAFFSCSKSWKTCMGIVFGMMWTSVWLL